MINPKALLWALLALPILALYAWRVRPRRHSVATGFLWEQVFSRTGHRAVWWSFRHPVSLCVQLAILALLVAALVEPHFGPQRRLVVVIDNSASMNATDVEPTRLDKAKESARQHVAALGYRDSVAIITAGDTLRVHCRLTSRLDTFEQALRAVEATNGPTRVVDAVALARRLLDGGPGGRILVFSDGCFDRAAELAQQEDVQLITVGGRGDNLGVTRFAARRGPADPLRCQILVEVASFSPEKTACRLQVELDGKPVDSVPIELAAGGRWQQVFEMTTAEGGRLCAGLDRPDVLAADDQASVLVPACPIYQVALVTRDDLYLKKVLEARSRVNLTVVDTVPEEVAEGTILVLHQRVPVVLPECPILVIDPTGPCQLWELGDSLEGPIVAGQNDGLPLLTDVRLEGVRLSGIRRLILTDKAQSMARPVAWTADGVPVGYAIDRPGGRVVVLSGVLGGGELPLRTAFPILFTNTLEWAAGSTAGWVSCLDPPYAYASRLPGESDVRVPAGLATRAEAAHPGPPGPPLWLFPAAMALVLLAAEWHLFQRRWTC